MASVGSSLKTMLEIWNKKLSEAENNLRIAEKEYEITRLKAEEKKGIEGIEKWLGYHFESSSCLTPEYAQFNKEIKNYIRRKLDKALKIISWSRMHFGFSCFIKNMLTGKIVYLSCSDVRFFSDSWYNNLLIRTAKNEKDFTGGRNDWCKLPDISRKALLLTL